MINRIAGKVACVVVPLVAVAVSAPKAAQAQACPAARAIFVFDRSGSMLDAGSDGRPKWQIGRDKALADFTTLTSGTPTTGTLVAVTSFGNTGLGATPYEQVLVSFESNKFRGTDDAALQAAIADAATGNASFLTPLAGGVCDEVDRLRNNNVNCGPGQVIPTQLFLYSDGLENSSPSTHPCFGAASSTTFDGSLIGSGWGLTPQSWQWKVANKAYTGNPQLLTPVGGDPFRVVANVNVLFDFVTANQSRHSEGVPTPGADLQSNPDANGIAFFKGLAGINYGNYWEAKRVNGQATVIPVYGDTNPTPTLSCVDDQDAQRILAAFGRQVRTGDPLFSAAELALRDVNNDLIINTLDYNIVVDHFGECHQAAPATTPTAAPIPRSATSFLGVVLAGLGAMLLRRRTRAA